MSCSPLLNESSQVPAFVKQAHKENQWFLDVLIASNQEELPEPEVEGKYSGKKQQR